MPGLEILFGFRGMDLNTARELIERALGVEFSSHDSFYRGGLYYLLKEPDAELILQHNRDSVDDDLAEAEYPDAMVLLYVDGGHRAEEVVGLLAARVPEAVLLRRVSR